MSKVKLLICEVFKQGEIDSGKNKKNGIALYLKVHLETFKLFVDERTLVRYYDAFVLGATEEINVDTDTLNKLSKYVGFRNFSDFSRTFVKKNEDANKTTVKISVDQNEESLTEKLTSIIINITNEQNIKVPEFIKQNGLGIMEIVLLISLVTGNVVFSNNKKITPLGFMSGSGLQSVRECMYWDGSEYRLADCKDKNPHLDLKPADSIRIKYFKRIERKDTLTVENALGKTWYSKYNGEVEFFTDDGRDPNNGRELRKSTPFIIDKYAGKPVDSIEVQE